MRKQNPLNIILLVSALILLILSMFFGIRLSILEEENTKLKESINMMSNKEINEYKEGCQKNGGIFTVGKEYIYCQLSGDNAKKEGCDEVLCTLNRIKTQ